MSNFDENFNQLKTLKETIVSLQGGFAKHLAGVSSATLTLLIVLRGQYVGNSFLYYLTLVLMLLCILASTAVLYISLTQHRILSKDFWKWLKESSHKAKEDTPFYPKYDKLLHCMEFFAIASFLLSFVCLVTYAFTV